jgi:hypothetical protein
MNTITLIDSCYLSVRQGVTTAVPTAVLYWTKQHLDVPMMLMLMLMLMLIETLTLMLTLSNSGFLGRMTVNGTTYHS